MTNKNWRPNKIDKKSRKSRGVLAFWRLCDKELKRKYFKVKLAHLANIIGEKLFEQIFGHKFETLANKLINTTNKEENQIIVKSINKTKKKLYEEDDTYDCVIQPNDPRTNLNQAINLILDFNKTIY